MSNEKQPSYYAIIPATVRYDENLKYAERILYGEITALLGKEGYCFASNNYFAELYGVINGTISRWISHLSKLGYIKVELIRNERKEIIERRIYITDISCKRILEDTYEQKSVYPISRKAKENNINIKIDRFFNYIINRRAEIYKVYQNFYEVIERLEFNYTKEMLKNLNKESIEKLKIIYYTINELLMKNRNNLLIKAKREDFINTYDSCKGFKELYSKTEDEIINFFDYYYVSIIKKLEAK